MTIASIFLCENIGLNFLDNQCFTDLGVFVRLIDNVDPDDLISVVWNSLTVAWIARRLAIPDGDAAGDRVDELKTQHED